MKFKCLFIFFTLYIQSAKCAFFDSSDTVCTEKLKVSRSQFDSWFQAASFDVIDVDDKFVSEYLTCWMTERRIVNKNGEINYDTFYDWIQTDAYGYFGKVEPKYPMAERKDVATKFVSQCQTEIGFDNNIGEKAVGIYNCIIRKIRNL